MWCRYNPCGDKRLCSQSSQGSGCAKIAFDIMNNDLQSGDLSRAGNDELFGAIQAFCEAQPSEGWRHDYTEVWDDSAITKTAAFANTFGGLVIVGVRKGKNDPKCILTGVSSASEYKTRIASSIASNISPIPSYEIAECHHPQNTAERFCVVRIRPGKRLHLVTKKNISPVYVRNEDESRPADAAQLRSLIDREMNIEAYPEQLDQQAESLIESLKVRLKYSDLSTDRWFLSSYDGSPTFLKLALVPADAIAFRIDASEEQVFRQTVHSIYRRVAQTAGRVALEAEDRGATYYEYVWFHKNVLYEVRWRMTSAGELGLATQIRASEQTWSVVDLAEHLILFLKLVIRWWNRINYFGEGRLIAQLNLSGLTLERTGDYGNYPASMKLANPSWPYPLVSGQAIDLSQGPRFTASTALNLDCFSLDAQLMRSCMLVLHALLRDLGHGVIWSKLEASLSPLVEP